MWAHSPQEHPEGPTRTVDVDHLVWTQHLPMALWMVLHQHHLIEISAHPSSLRALFEPNPIEKAPR
jgi:hypothetical protein